MNKINKISIKHLRMNPYTACRTEAMITFVFFIFVHRVPHDVIVLSTPPTVLLTLGAAARKDVALLEIPLQEQ